MNEQEAKALQESNTKLQETVAAQGVELARLRERELVRDARAVAERTLRPLSLPDVTKARLVEHLSANPPAVDGALDPAFVARVTEAAKAEAAYLASVSESGAGRILGMNSAEPADVKPEAAAASLASSLQRLGLSESAAKVAAGV